MQYLKAVRINSKAVLHWLSVQPVYNGTSLSAKILQFDLHVEMQNRNQTLLWRKPGSKYGFV